MAPSQAKPNIILIVTDQQRYDTMNALGFPYLERGTALPSPLAHSPTSHHA